MVNRRPAYGDIALSCGGRLGMVYCLVPTRLDDTKDLYWTGLALHVPNASPNIEVKWHCKSPRVLFNIFQLAASAPECYCPACGSPMPSAQTSPMSVNCARCGWVGYGFRGEQDVIVKLNWDELRLMADYAQRYARAAQCNIDHMRLIAASLGRVRRARPAEGGPILAEDFELEQDLARRQQVEAPPPQNAPEITWKN